MSSRGRRRQIPFVVVAPSGTGKTTICHRVVEGDDGIVFSVSHTTRARREGEVDGEDYHFVTPSEFERLAGDGAFLEWALYNGNRYGTSWESIRAPLAEGRDVLLEIEVEGARQVRERRDDACFIFLLPPSMKVLGDRLRGRGTDSPEQIRRRLDRAGEELEAIGDFDYAVVNDDLDRCVGSVMEIIRAERAGGSEELRRRFAVAPAYERFKRAGAAGQGNDGRPSGGPVA
jgi:guanylate kinase